MSSNTETLDSSTIRERMKNTTPEEFVAAHTRAQLDQFAETMEADTESASNKQEVYEALVAVADLPDPSLRGNSTVDSPVAQVWAFCDEHAAEINSGDLRRKDAIAQLQEMGVAYYTARTQYQSWFSATNKGERRVADLSNEDLPRELQSSDEEEGDES